MIKKVGSKSHCTLILWKVLLFLLPTILAYGETKLMLDDMSRFFDEAAFPSAQYNELVGCFNKWGDRRVLQAQDAAWEKLYETWVTGDISWGSYQDKFLESNRTGQAYFGPQNRNYQIQEKCNYVSNVAQYSSAIRICEHDWFSPAEIQAALMKITATLAVSSCWFHGSMTNVGARWDGKSISVALKNVYQICVSSIDTNSTIFLTASDDLEPTTITDLTDRITFFSLNKSLAVSDWTNYVAALPSASIENYAAAFLAFNCAVAAPFSFCEKFIDTLAPAFLTEAEVEFIRERYLPELKSIALEEGFPIPAWNGVPLLTKGFGVMMSLIWAFLFQEQTLDVPCLEGPFLNTTVLGVLKTPMVNFVLDMITGITNSARKWYNGKEEYPGANFCNRHSPHALWHQLSADALFNLYVSADDVNKVLTKRKKQRERAGF